jgi:hypothetical protein
MGEAIELSQRTHKPAHGPRAEVGELAVVLGAHGFAYAKERKLDIVLLVDEAGACSQVCGGDEN